MATIAVVPIILTDIDLTLGADNYEAHVARAEFVPTTPKAKWKGMTPTAIHNLTGTPEWVLNLDLAQDHVTAASLSQYLATNAGAAVVAKLKPKKGTVGSTPTFTATVVCEPAPIGGALDATATGSVSLAVNGQPVRSLT